MPKLWNETIGGAPPPGAPPPPPPPPTAVLDTTASLVAEHGLTSVTMSRIAEESGIGRATLYKYFPDVEAILLAWHERQIAEHLDHLTEVRDQADGTGERLEAVLGAFALVSYYSRRHHDNELATLLHRDQQVTQAQQRLHAMIRELLTEGTETGDVRDDIDPDELTSYCLHALTAAGDLPSKAAVHRLVTVTLTGVRPAARHSDSGGAAGHSRYLSGKGDSSSAQPPRGHRRHTAHGPHPTDS